MLFKDLRFSSLTGGALVSTASSFFLLLVWAGHVFTVTGRNLQSASVFAVSWILPLAFVRMNARLLARFDARNVLVGTALAQAVAASCLLLLPSAIGGGLLAVLALRGGIEGLEKTARLARLKAVIHHETLERANSIASASTYTGIALGALGAALASQFLTVTTATILAAFGYAVASLIYRIGPLPLVRTGSGIVAPTADGLREFVRILKTSHLGVPFVGIMICTGLFQGFHNVARTAYGVEYLRLDVAALSYLQLTATAAVILGALFVGRFVLTGSPLAALKPMTWVLITAVSLQLILLTNMAVLGFSLYFVFIFLFEVSFTRIQNILIVRCPKERSVVFFSWLQALTTGGMALCVFALAALIDALGLQGALLSIFSLCVLAFAFQLRRRPIVALVESYNTPAALIEAIDRRGWATALLRGPVGSMHHNPSLTPAALAKCEIVMDCNPEAAASLKAACKRLPQSRLRRLLTISEYNVVNVAAVGSELGLAFTASAGVNMAKDKLMSKDVLRKAGLLSMRSQAIDDPLAQKDEIVAFGFPSVLKHRSGAASVQVYILRNAEDVTRSLVTIEAGRQQPAETLQGTFSRQAFVLETYLVGPMLSLEVVRASGSTVLLTVGQRARAEHDESIEISTLMPGNPAAVSNDCLQNFVHRACEELGLDKGVFHIECVLTEGGLELIEVNPRLMGGSLPAMYTATHQTPIFDVLLAAYLDDIVPTQAAEAQQVGLSCFLAPLEAGVIPADFSLARMRADLPRGADFVFFKAQGDAFEACRSNHDYLGRICFYGPTRANVVAQRQIALDLIESTLRVRIARPHPFSEGL